MPPDERLGHIDIEDEMRSSYLSYAMSVIVGRALPDVRDGLKPVHRRILFGMNEMGLASNRAYRKSAKIVGEIMGNYHPHGDMPIYDTLVRMAQDFNMRYHARRRSGQLWLDGRRSPGRQRYTEARMTKLAEEMLADIDKETVDFGPNYDESLVRSRWCSRPECRIFSSTAPAASRSAMPPTFPPTISPKSSMGCSCCWRIRKSRSPS